MESNKILGFYWILRYSSLRTLDTLVESETVGLLDCNLQESLQGADVHSWCWLNDAIFFFFEWFQLNDPWHS